MNKHSKFIITMLVLLLLLWIGDSLGLLDFLNEKERITNMVNFLIIYYFVFFTWISFRIEAIEKKINKIFDSVNRNQDACL